MPAWLIPAAISAVQMGVGALQRRKARKEREKAMADFNYEIPSATKEQLQLARERASLRQMPGEDITRSRLDAEVAQTLEAPVDTATDLLGLYAKAYGQKGDYVTQLQEKGAAYQAQQEAALQQALANYGQAEEQQFYYNRYMPFMSQMGYAGDLAAGGAANFQAGFQGLTSTFANEFANQQMMDMFGGDSGGTYKPQLSADNAMMSRERLRNMNLSIPGQSNLTFRKQSPLQQWNQVQEAEKIMNIPLPESWANLYK